MKKIAILSLLLFSCLATFAGQDNDTIYLTQTEVNNLYKTTSKNYAGVHDPSLVNDRKGHVYIFGSHNAIARTSDMMSWTGVGNANLYGKQSPTGSVTACNFNDAFITNMTKKVTILKDGKPTEVTFGNFDAKAWHCAIPNDQGGAWTVNGNMWAPDVIWNEQMQKWCMYLSLNGPKWNSAIILLTATNIEGPYVYQGPVVYTGFNNTTNAKVSWKLTDLELVIGEQSTLPQRYNLGNNWGSFMPHAIDPCVFYDEEGELWMSYGSWSGGIFILKLDKENGLRDYTTTYPLKTDGSGHPLSDPYFGTQIAGGYYVSGEGSYIQHIGDYYYLFVTYGGLEAKGGYTMRTFRSKNPDGPYTDNSGESAIFNRYLLNYGPNDGPQRGNLLVGAFDKWSFQANGEVAQGHNSAISDDKGRTFLIYHTRFNTGNEWFQDRVHQLFTNEKGWLLSAPMEFNGETVTDEDIKKGCAFTPAQIPGEYSLLIHKFGLKNDELATAKPITVSLNANGKVSGDATGTWKMIEGTAYVTLTVGGTTYYGVVVEQTVDGSNMKAIGITSSSQNGQMLWAYKVLPQHAVAYNVQKISATVSNSATISSHIDLTADTYYGVSYEWISSEPSVISHDGKYNPADTVTRVTLTNRIAKENYVWEKSYSVRAAKADSLPGDYLSGIVAYYDFDEKPTNNRYNEEERITHTKMTSGTTAELRVDGARIGMVGHIFGGTNADKTASYMRMPNPFEAATDLKAFTISAWMKRGNAKDLLGTAWAFTGSTPTSSAAQERFFYTLNNYVGFTNLTDTFAINYPRTASTVIPAGEWKLVTVTVDETGVAIYVNGMKRTASFASTAGTRMADFDMQKVMDVVSGAKYFCLGIGNGISSAEADYDDLLIYDRALTAEDVKLLYSMEKRVTDYGPDAQTAIGEILAGDGEDVHNGSLQSGYYDLSGRRIARPTQPGLYIHNGKLIRVL